MAWGQESFMEAAGTLEAAAPSSGPILHHPGAGYSWGQCGCQKDPCQTKILPCQVLHFSDINPNKFRVFAWNAWKFHLSLKNFIPIFMQKLTIFITTMIFHSNTLHCKYFDCTHYRFWQCYVSHCYLAVHVTAPNKNQSQTVLLNATEFGGYSRWLW